MAETIWTVSPEGNVQRVSRKAFDLSYKALGFREIQDPTEAPEALAAMSGEQLAARAAEQAKSDEQREAERVDAAFAELTAADPGLTKALIDAGFSDPEQTATLTDEELGEIKGIGKGRLKTLRSWHPQVEKPAPDEEPGEGQGE